VASRIVIFNDSVCKLRQSKHHVQFLSLAYKEIYIYQFVHVVAPRNLYPSLSNVIYALE
jgi:hypothetical protein